MKRFVCILLLVALAAGFCVGCERRRTPEEIWDSMVDQKKVDEFNQRFKEGNKRLEAEMKGDTYCGKCDKFIPGKVRICTYCGQYI